jgi:hypothetical protein
VEEEETSGEATDPFIQRRTQIMSKTITNTTRAKRKAIMKEKGQKTTEEEVVPHNPSSNKSA